MKKFLYFSCLVFVISVCFIGIKAGVLKQTTNDNYAEYVHKYNKIKKVAEQYENNAGGFCGSCGAYARRADASLPSAVRGF